MGNTHLWSYLAQFVLEWEMFQIKFVEKIDSHFMFNKLLFEDRAVWDNVETYCRAGQVTQKTVWRIRIACWVTTATNTHSVNVMFIAFPQQQWYHEYATMLRYTYAAFCYTIRSIYNVSYGNNSIKINRYSLFFVHQCISDSRTENIIMLGISCKLCVTV